MKHTYLSLASALLVLAGCATQPSADVEALQHEIAELRAKAGPPPASLDALYPPQAAAPLYQIRMHDLGGPLSGMVVDLMEGDLENVAPQFEAFRTAYGEVAALVPEWTHLYPIGPVDELGSALEEGAQDRIMAAIQRVGAVCHDCHVDYMPKVHQRYQWPQFSAVRATDPVTRDEVPMAGYMRAMETSFSGMMTSLQQAQPDRARGYYDEFFNRFGGLADLCTNCHDTEREYFIDESVQRLVRQIGTELQADAPDPAAIGSLAQRVGTEACFRCHLVHVPAAFAQAGWSGGH